MSSTQKSGDKKSTEERSDPIMKWATRVVLLTLFLALCSWLDAINDRWHVFEPSKLHELARDAIAAHPDDIAPEFASTPTNANGSSTMPAASWAGCTSTTPAITEYLIIFCTPLGTEGHSGIHTADDYLYILSGEEWAYTLGSFEKEVYPTGSVNLMPRGMRKQYKMQMIRDGFRSCCHSALLMRSLRRWTT